MNALCDQCSRWQHDQQQQSQKTLLMTMPMIDDSDNDETNSHSEQILNFDRKLSLNNHQSTKSRRKNLHYIFIII